MDKHDELHEYASKYLVAGISSSVRINQAIGRPFYISRGDGSKIYDLDGKEFIDMCTSHGAALLGHNNPMINAAIMKALQMGTICAAETKYHSELARKITEMVPCADLVRFTGSGTETTMHCIRLAREYTGKDKILRFQGHFHGYHDMIYIGGHPPADKAGPEESPSTFRESGGIPKVMEDLIIPIPFNRLDLVEDTIKKRKGEIACLIMEPINFDCGGIFPKPGFLEGVREITRDNDVLLIFDEIITGFRMGKGGAQEYFGVTPDLCTLGKSMGGGTTISAFCGRREIMEHVAPLGNSAHGGTYNGHLITVLAANAAMDEYSRPGFYDQINALGNRLYNGMKEIIRGLDAPMQLPGCGARFGIFCGIKDEVTNYREALNHDIDMMLRFVKAMIDRGVYFHDYSGLPAHHGFSSAHTIEDIDMVLDAVEGAVKEIS